MIKVNELRIGNVISRKSDTKSDFWEVCIVDLDILKLCIDHPELFSHVPVTPFGLYKCGFHTEGAVKFSNNLMELHYNSELGDYRYRRADGSATSIYFLHHLQNLFFDLFGEELTVNFE